jgi:hypothetical protein
MKNTKKNLLWLAVALLGVSGCAGSDPVIEGRGDALLGPDVAPLATAAPDSLGTAPDCAGVLGDVEGTHLTFEIASLSAGLVAVVNGAGQVVCVDSVSDVTSDLDASGQSSTADAVTAGFLAAVHEADGRNLNIDNAYRGGDPEPQPNMRSGSPLPDPEPQPN